MSDTKTKLFEKKLNKLLVGFVIGGAIFGAGAFGMSPKGRGFFSRIKNKFRNIRNFFALGYKELKLKIKRK